MASNIVSRRSAYLSLTLLLSINLMNYLDRYMLAAVLPYVEDDPAFQGVTKWQLGLLAPAFVWVYMIASPIFGWLGDRMSRWLIVGMGVITWSLASGGTGLAMSYAMLFATRCIIGVGEAAYGPVAPTLLSDLFPIKIRGQIMSWFYMAIPVGSAAGYLFSGQIAGSSLGWRWAFYLVVIPGLILGILCFFMREPAMGQSDHEAPHRRATRQDYFVLLKIRSFVLNTIAATGMCFALGGLSYWMPYYIYDRETNYEWTERVRSELSDPKAGLPTTVFEKLDDAIPDGLAFADSDAFRTQLVTTLTEEENRAYRQAIMEKARTETSTPIGTVTLFFGVIVAVGGLTATLFGGLIADKLRPRFPGSYFAVSGYSALLGLPFFLGVLVTPFPLAWGLLFIAVFCLFMNTGPSNTILANVVPASVRSMAFALNIFIIHALGDAISPFIIGLIADMSTLTNGMLVVSLMIGVSGVIWVMGTPHLQADTEAAPTRLDPITAPAAESSSDATV